MGKIEIGKKIAMLRQEQGISQSDLARYLLVTPQTISRWEVGNGTPDIDFLPKIAFFFNVSIDYLFQTTKLQEVQESVSKYSIMRSEKCFLDAKKKIELSLQEIKQLDNSNDYNKSLLEKKHQIMAEEIHLYVQESRSIIEKTISLIEDFQKDIDHSNPWFLPLCLQKAQLKTMLGENHRQLMEAEFNFKKNPSLFHLHLLLEIAVILQENDYICNFLASNTEAKTLLNATTEDTVSIHKIWIIALLETNEIDLALNKYGVIKSISSSSIQYEILISIAHFYSRNNNEALLQETKESLYQLLDMLNLDSYYYNEMKNNIQHI